MNSWSVSAWEEEGGSKEKKGQSVGVGNSNCANSKWYLKGCMYTSAGQKGGLVRDGFN